MVGQECYVEAVQTVRVLYEYGDSELSTGGPSDRSGTGRTRIGAVWDDTNGASKLSMGRAGRGDEEYDAN